MIFRKSANVKLKFHILFKQPKQIIKRKKS